MVFVITRLQRKEYSYLYLWNFQEFFILKSEASTRGRLWALLNKQRANNIPGKWLSVYNIQILKKSFWYSPAIVSQKRLLNSKVKVKMKLLSRVQLFATLWTVAYQASPSMGFFQARVLECVTISFSRGFSWPSDWTRVSCIVGRCFTVWAPREVKSFQFWIQKLPVLNSKVTVN